MGELIQKEREQGMWQHKLERYKTRNELVPTSASMRTQTADNEANQRKAEQHVERKEKGNDIT